MSLVYQVCTEGMSTSVLVPPAAEQTSPKRRGLQQFIITSRYRLNCVPPKDMPESPVPMNVTYLKIGSLQMSSR